MWPLQSHSTSSICDTIDLHYSLQQPSIKALTTNHPKTSCSKQGVNTVTLPWAKVGNWLGEGSFKRQETPRLQQIRSGFVAWEHHFKPRWTCKSKHKNVVWKVRSFLDTLQKKLECCNLHLEISPSRLWLLRSRLVIWNLSSHVTMMSPVPPEPQKQASITHLDSKWHGSILTV